MACSRHDQIANSIFEDYEKSDRRAVNLNRALPQPWKRVCMLGPYTDNETTHATLGFKWDSEAVSDIRENEGIMLLVFVAADKKVAFFTNYPRRKGDFANMNHQCFERSDARFEKVDNPKKGRAGLVPIKQE